MVFIDVHAHLDYPDFEKDLDQVIQRAKDSGIKVIIATGVDNKSNKTVLEMSKKYDTIKAALGIYPPDALAIEKDGKEFSKDIYEDIKFIEKNIDKIIAVSEIGLDYQNCQDKEFQKSVFKKQLELAKKYDKPVIVHSRKAEEDVINILEEIDYKKVVLHCFCGKKSLIKKAVEMGFYFSIPTNIVRAQNFQELVKEVNINKILTETDSPFLSPFKEKRNEPSFIIESVKKIAEIKGFTFEETENNIFLNYQRLFT